jgi:hypothetical protein
MSTHLYALVGIQIAAADPTTAAAPTAVADPVALACECTSKRHSSGGRDASVDGVDSSIKKRPDTRWSPRNRVTIAADEAVDMDMLSDLIRMSELTNNVQHSVRIHRESSPVSLSPNDSTVDNPAALLPLNLRPQVAGRR